MRSLVIHIFSITAAMGFATGFAQTCPTPSGPTSFAADSPTVGYFDALVAANPGGVVVNGTDDLTLDFEAGQFVAAAGTVAGGGFRVAAAIDVNGDGLKDLIAGRRGPQTLSIRHNNAPSTTPHFTDSGTVLGGTGQNCSVALVAGDFDNDGLEDVVRVRCSSDATRVITGVDVFRNTGTGLDAAFSGADPSVISNMGLIERSTTSMVAYDWNSDGCQDILFGNTSGTGATDGQISVLVNRSDCATNPPRFTQTVLIPNIAMDDGPAALAYGDVNNDGYEDLVASSPATPSIFIWTGTATGFNPRQTLATNGNAQGLWLADFSRDGFPDLMWAENLTNQVHYWENTFAVDDPISFAGSPIIFMTANADVDAGAVLDLEGNGTLDLVVGDFNVGPPAVSDHTILTNGTFGTYVECAEVDSPPIDLGPLATVDFSTYSATITPVESLNGGDIKYFAQNDPTEPWVEATDCDGGARGPSFCAVFPTQSGRTLRWRAQLCTNGSPTPPTLTSFDYSFSYEGGTISFEAGSVASTGIVYASGYQGLNDSGRLFALRGDLGTQLWEASTVIDAQATRNIYTTELTSSTRLDFSTPATAALRTTLSTGGTAAEDDDLINWAIGPRFGSVSPSKFGALVNSTPAVMAPPGLPSHYTFLSLTARGVVDSFISSNQNRPVQVFVAGKSGMIHAINSDPPPLSAGPGVPADGSEQWGFIPAIVAQGLNGDRVAGNITRYVDGSPTLADVYDPVLGDYITTLLVGGGEGHSSVTALNVSNSSTTGPVELWTDDSQTGPSLPGDGPGNATSKAAVIRVETSPSTEEGKFMVVMASGRGAGARTGRRVIGRELDGTVLWYFDAACAVTTDITAFETDDTGAFGLPGVAGDEIDGYTDRVVFGDQCGYLYMINVNNLGITQPSTPPVLAPLVGTPPIDTGRPSVVAGVNILAHFATSTTTNAIGAEREIAGSIAARADSSTDMVLYFGTGGHEAVAPGDVNEFYAVFAKDGSIRSKLTGVCPTAGHCEKFYGGPIVTESQVIFVATVDSDPVATCDPGSSRVLFAANSGDPGGALNFLDLDTVNVAQAITAPAFAASGAVYITTKSGRVQMIGNTTAPNPGDNAGQESTATDAVKGEYIAVSGWRQALY